MNIKQIAKVLVPATLTALCVFGGCARTHSTLASAHEPLITPSDASIEESSDNADIRVRRERVMAVSAECAYDTLADIERWSSWDSTVEETRFVDGEQAAVGAVFYQDLGAFQGNAQILAAERGRVLRWRGQNPDGSGPVGVHTWTFVPQEDGTTLVINDEHFHGWYLRPLGWVTDLGVGDQFDRTLAELEKAADAGC